MKNFILAIIYLCSAANAQFPNTRFQSPNGQNTNSRFGNSNYQLQNTNAKQYQPSSFGAQKSFQQNGVRQNQYQASQYQSSQSQPSQYQSSQYQSSQYQSNQFQQQSSGRSGASCSEKNGRSPVSGACDRYIECINGTAEEKLCPDGLRFNPNVNFNVYPCQYPNEVQCLERSALQEAQPTEQCPHQFGWFRLGDARNCSAFRSCVNGVAYDFTCPEGLAFSEDTYRCEWPDQVSDCDAEVPKTKELGPPTGYRFYKSDANCQKYFMCIEGRPRALSCGAESAFDESSLSCVLADEVASCPAELKAAAAHSRELEARRLAEELAHNTLRS